MSQTGRFKYLDGSTFQALEMPYAGKDLAMVVFLPRKAHGLAEPPSIWLTGSQRRQLVP